MVAGDLDHVVVRKTVATREVKEERAACATWLAWPSITRPRFVAGRITDDSRR